MGWFNKTKKAEPRLDDSHLRPGSALAANGQASANQVFKAPYDAAHGMGTEAYFKADGDMAPAKSAVGASRLAKGLGWGNLIPETRFATHDLPQPDGTTAPTLGAVSKGATGVPLAKNVFDTFAGPAAPGQTTSSSYEVRNGTAFSMTGNEFSDVDLSAPNTQKQLNQLQWFDALIGNSDRHGGNILVDPATGDVSGIDNDLSFGHDDAIQSHKSNGQVSPEFSSGWDGKYLGLPSQIDKETAKALKGLDKKKLKAMLNPKGEADAQKFSKEELAATTSRLKAIKAAIKDRKKNGGLVTNWDGATYAAATNENRAGRTGDAGSYVQRQHLDLQKASDPTNNLAWRPGRRAADAPASTTSHLDPNAAPAPLPAPVAAPLPAPRQAPAPPPQSAKPNRPIVQPGNLRPKPRVLERLKGTDLEHIH
ncbi:MAG: hypothetical protein ACXIVQ_16090 [Acidimicrobiales bacterium]